MRQVRLGDCLGHYKIETVVARSGMASIFKATDVRTSMPVAIKVPHPETENDPALFDSFRREIEIGQKLNHPGVVKVLPNHDRSRVYMVMEWVEGKPLRDILSERRTLAPERAARLTQAICEALEHVHANGIVHHDLKPENVMVDAEDRIKIIDFGIASHAAARRITFSKITHVMGTPSYISPEQVKGKRGDARSDLYAVGVMLYEMLTGKDPFTGRNPFAVMNDRLINYPVPPRELDPEISPQVQEIVYRALERDPKDRYAGAREFAADLAQPERVGVAERDELTAWKQRRTPASRQALAYAGILGIPVVVFGLLMYVARHS